MVRDRGRFGQPLTSLRVEVPLAEEPLTEVLGLSVQEALVSRLFDPRDHPRDTRGRFRETLRDLAVGSALRLPDGTTVKRDEADSFRVTSSGKIVRGLDAGAAVDDALDRSARKRNPEAVGGEQAFRSFDAVVADPATPFENTEGDGLDAKGPPAPRVPHGPEPAPEPLGDVPPSSAFPKLPSVSGRLFHGTSVDGAASIRREGVDPARGSGAQGRGFYLTPEEAYARKRAGDGGEVLPFDVDVNRVMGSEEYAAINAAVGYDEERAFEEVRRRGYGAIRPHAMSVPSGGFIDNSGWLVVVDADVVRVAPDATADAADLPALRAQLDAAETETRALLKRFTDGDLSVAPEVAASMPRVAGLRRRVREASAIPSVEEAVRIDERVPEPVQERARDLLRSLGPLPRGLSVPVEVSSENMPPWAQGAYFLLGNRIQMSSEITSRSMSRSTAEFHALNLAHEVAHAIDGHAGDGTYATDSEDPAWTGFRDAAEASPLVRRYRRMLKKGTIPMKRPDGERVERPLPDETRKMVEYLASPQELWARAATQLMAEQSESDEARRNIEARQASRNLPRRGFSPAWYWKPDEWPPVRDAVKRVLKGL